MSRPTHAAMRSELDAERRKSRLYLYGWWGTLGLWALSVALRWWQWKDVL